MTENAFYPSSSASHSCSCGCWNDRRMRTSSARSPLSALAYGTRQQALALFAAVLTAPLLLGLRRLGRFRTLYARHGLVAALALVVEAARGRSPLSLLGAYESTGRHGYSVGAVAKWLLWHVAELDLYLGVIPSRRSSCSRSRGGASTRRSVRSWPALLLSPLWLLLEVAAFATLPGVGRVEERTRSTWRRCSSSRCCFGCSSARRVRASSRRSGRRRGLLVATLPFPRLIGAGDHVGHARARPVVEGERAGARAARRAAGRHAVRARSRGVVPGRAAALGTRAAAPRARVLLRRAAAGAGARGRCLAQCARSRHRRPAGLDRPRGSRRRRRRRPVGRAHRSARRLGERVLQPQRRRCVRRRRTDSGEPRVDAGRRRQVGVLRPQPAERSASQRRDARPARRAPCVRRRSGRRRLGLLCDRLVR